MPLQIDYKLKLGRLQLWQLRHIERRRHHMSHTDRVFTLIAVAVVLTITVGLWLTNLL